MRQRLALAISSVVAASVLAVGLSAAGFGPDAPTVASDDDFEVAQANADDPTEAAEPEIVYVKPAPPPKTVVKVKQAKAKAKNGSSAKRRTSRVRVEDRDDERERERDHDDDDHRGHEREREDD